ncbi:hypothetical protein B8W66_09155 [Mycobacterium decipiens]|uniref:Uncharacterized protein n=1 Tax=Mycobacterium decipiens TaxID=1430326 RepID=A0A1X2LVV7_9MYCO|nr:hypothetical protein B8W66_09155 [Mycobacterium decipiens]
MTIETNAAPNARRIAAIGCRESRAARGLASASQWFAEVAVTVAYGKRMRRNCSQRQVPPSSVPRILARVSLTCGASSRKVFRARDRGRTLTKAMWATRIRC